MRVSILVMAFLPYARTCGGSSGCQRCVCSQHQAQTRAHGCECPSWSWPSCLTLGLAEVLQAVSVASVLSIKLRLELTDASVHPGHGLLASLEGRGLGVVHAGLHVLNLGLKESLLSLQRLGELLLRSEFISKTGSINHGALGLLLGQRSLTSHLVTVSLEGLDLRLQLHLGSLDGLVGAGLVGQGLVCVLQLLLHHTAGAVSLLQESAGLLKSVLVGVGLALSID